MNYKVVKYLINKNDTICISVDGDCMEPFFKDGELITVRKLNKKLKVGDIVLIFTDGVLKIHRLILIKKHKIYTKGDNVCFIDSNINKNNILGYYSKDIKIRFIYLYTKLSFLEGIIFGMTKNKNNILLIIINNIKNYFKLLYMRHKHKKGN